ncbi:MAG: bifunctional 4-hydroxy-2-oxoglutarate aldolase/2-dehydro-3-deoxy-phosphogluconate aldolase [Desulfobacteraceae bacterium]|nr:bifunctional 4-hydroxy-2-oxoglutarate aldolase/2-dehydro-3-deoxy-phosphogluconate aldolase [Desulfobacteraceae bacterium]
MLDGVEVIGILRGISPGLFPGVMAASFAAGLMAIEVTMNTPGAEEIVRRARPQVPEGRLLGMGTIRDLAEARRAVAAGAMFLVSPNFDPQVIAYAKSQAVPIVVGALTPTEVYAAWKTGAAMVKVFPCAPLGPGYLRELLGPFDHLPLVAVGGVTAANVEEYFAAGAAAVGVGASLFGKEALASGDLAAVEANVADFLRRCPGRRAGEG